MEISKEQLHKLFTFVAYQQKFRDYQDAGYFLNTGSQEEIISLLDELSDGSKNWFTNDVVNKTLSVDDILELFVDYQ
jgi:hypothetical protein